MRNSITLSILFITALFLVGCDQDGGLVSVENAGSEQEAALARTAAENSEEGMGTLLERSFMHEGTLRSYLLYVPGAYDEEDDWPLVISYHGFNVGAAFQVDLSRMNPVADTEHFLIAYPQGLLVNNPFTGTMGPGWNIGGTLSENDDVDFSQGLIDHVSDGYRLDRSRVHATGHSMGAAMTYDVACALPDQVASVAGVANQMSDGQIDTCAPGRALSFLQIHGTTDPIVPFDGIQSGDLVFSAAPETASFWAEQNDCSSDLLSEDLEDAVPEDNSTVTLFEYAGCNHNTEVLFYQVNNGGHTWPGGGSLPPFFGAINQDINASAEIWDFFVRNPHPGTIRVCHVPPGNPANARTITVSVNALPAHLAHGDTEGACEGVS